MIRIALRAAAFACGLGIAFPSWAQTTPVSQFPSSQTVDWPLHTVGGAVRLYDINGNVVGGATHPFMVQCPDGTVNCFGAGTAGFTQTDESAFTAGISAFGPGGGIFQTTATSNALTNGQMGAFQATANRALFTNLRNSSGTEIGTVSTPVQVSVANTASSMTNVSGSIAAGGTAQLLFTGANVRGFELQNLSPTEALGFSWWTTTPVIGSSGTYVLAAGSQDQGGYYVTPPTMGTFGTISVYVIGATTAHAFTGSYWQ